MKNSRINSQLSYLDKSFESFKNTMIEEVEKLENTLDNEKKLISFNNILISKLYLKLFKDTEYNKTVYKIFIGGFKSNDEARIYSYKDFKTERYSSSLCYVIKSDNPYKLKDEMVNLKINLLYILETIYNKDCVLCDENSIIAKNNKEVYEGLINYITSLGFKKSYNGKKTARSKKTETLEYGFIKELKSQVNDYWAENSSLKFKNDLINQFDIISEDLIKNLFNNRNDSLSKNKDSYFISDYSNVESSLDVLISELEKFKQEGLIRLPYINGVLDIYKIKDKLLNIDNLLEVGYWLEVNRNKIDLGDTYAIKASAKLKNLIKYTYDNKEKSFLIELDNELDNCLKNYNDDGRIFRDMKINYDKIYNHIVLKNQLNNNLSNIINRLIEIEVKLKLI